jgi:hypothetical protein
MKAAIRDDDCVLFFEHKYLYRRIKGVMPAGDHVVPIGKARVAREGTDLSIITYAATVHKALEAAEQLEAEDGLSVEVLDLRTLAPLDDEAIVATVKKTNRVLVVHEDTRTGGIAGEITARISESCFEWLDAPVLRVTAHDVPLPYAPQLEDFVLPQRRAGDGWRSGCAAGARRSCARSPRSTGWRCSSGAGHRARGARDQGRHPPLRGGEGLGARSRRRAPAAPPRPAQQPPAKRPAARARTARASGGTSSTRAWSTRPSPPGPTTAWSR